MNWEPELRSRLKKLKKLRQLREVKEVKEEANLREQQRRATFQSFSPSSDIKMVVGDWYTDELGNHARLIYNAKTADFESPYDSLRPLVA